MEADGMKFYNTNGVETEIFTLMKQIGMNAIRLRVWVNPENGYGPWSNKADVLDKARRADAQGLDLMIDFHLATISLTLANRQNLPLGLGCRSTN